MADAIDDEVANDLLIERANRVAKKVSDMIRKEAQGPYEAFLACCSCVASMATEVTLGDKTKAEEVCHLIVKGMFS